MPQSHDNTGLDLTPITITDADLHAQHHQYIETLIRKEEQRIAFRQAVIEKTTASLLYSGIIAAGVYIAEQVRNHWK